jgi:hypothetical protein
MTEQGKNGKEKKIISSKLDLSIRTNIHRFLTKKRINDNGCCGKSLRPLIEYLFRRVAYNLGRVRASSDEEHNETSVEIQCQYQFRLLQIIESTCCETVVRYGRPSHEFGTIQPLFFRRSSHCLCVTVKRIALTLEQNNCQSEYIRLLLESFWIAIHQPRLPLLWRTRFRSKKKN